MIHRKRWGRPPKCPDCGRRAYYHRTSPNSEYVECRACGSINPRPVCPDCGTQRTITAGCRACGTRKGPVWPAEDA